MKIVVAIDSFKGSMTSMQAGYAAKEGILRVIPDADVVVRPLADGGEGTTDALIEGLGGIMRTITVTGPLGKLVSANYGILPEKKMAIIEMAAAAGITLELEKKPLIATTYGVGEMIVDAINEGCENFIIGIGGSATNDGGVGMLQALGYVFLDENNNPVEGGASCLEKIISVDDKNVLSSLKHCKIKVACDVNNPLYGSNGATYVYGPQKGITDELLETVENGMKNYAKISANYLGENYADKAGTGAAGGLGFALLAYLNATLTAGIELILNAIELEKDMKTADYVITGEGRLDFQTAMGKVPVGVAKLAKKYGRRVIAFSGSVTPDARECNRQGIDAFFPIMRSVVTLDEAMDTENAKNNMSDTVEQVFRLLL